MMKADRKRRILYSVLTVFASLLVLFIILEIIARIAGFTSTEMYDPDDQLIWKLRPNQETYTKVFKKPVKINDKGFRCDHFNEIKDCNVYRIISFGDSTTYGWGMDISDTYHQVAKKILNNAGLKQHIEWIDAGVAGYNLYQELCMFKACLKYCPDMITVTTTWNEYWNFELLSKSELINRKRMVRIKSFLRRFAAFNLFFELKGAWVYIKLRNKLLISELYGGNENSDQNLLRFYRAHIKEFISICSEKGIKLVFIIVNSPEKRTDILLEEAKAAGVDILDFYPIVDQNRIGKSELGIYDSHPNKRGHELIGKALSNYILKSVSQVN